MRGAMIEALRQDYVRTARAKGASEPRVLWRHAFVNALAPVLTILGLSFGALFSGALITETMFAWPGMGKAIYQGILDNDYNLALVGLLITTFATIVGNLLADLALVAVDPRVSLSMRACAVASRRGLAPHLRHRLAQVSLVFLAILLVLALAAPLIAEMRGVDPTMTDLLRRFEPPSAEFWLGTDELGRDLFQRLLDGGRVSLLVGFSGALLSAVIGAVIGVVAGYLGGRLDSLLMRVTDGVIALPLLPLLIVLAAIDPQKVGIPARRRAVGDLLALPHRGDRRPDRLDDRGAAGARRDAVAQGARLHPRGAGAGRAAAAHHVPPHPAQRRWARWWSPRPCRSARLILLESTLSFLGLGTQPPAASWGNMLTNAQDLLQDAPILALWPGLLIFLTVIAFNFLGDGLQDALDPRSERR